MTSNSNSSKAKRCRDPSEGAPSVWVAHGATQHLAFLLLEDGDRKFIRWASTLKTEWLDGSVAVSRDLGSRRGRRSTVPSATTAVVKRSSAPNRVRRTKTLPKSNEKPPAETQPKKQTKEQPELETKQQEEDQQQEQQQPSKKRKRLTIAEEEEDDVVSTALAAYYEGQTVKRSKVDEAPKCTAAEEDRHRKEMIIVDPALAASPEEPSTNTIAHVNNKEDERTAEENRHHKEMPVVDPSLAASPEEPSTNTMAHVNNKEDERTAEENRHHKEMPDPALAASPEEPSTNTIAHINSKDDGKNQATSTSPNKASEKPPPSALAGTEPTKLDASLDDSTTEPVNNNMADANDAQGNSMVDGTISINNKNDEKEVAFTNNQASEKPLPSESGRTEPMKLDASLDAPTTELLNDEKLDTKDAQSNRMADEKISISNKDDKKEATCTTNKASEKPPPSLLAGTEPTKLDVSLDAPTTELVNNKMSDANDAQGNRADDKICDVHDNVSYARGTYVAKVCCFLFLL